MSTSEMAFLDLAPGDPLSQDGSLRPFSYSQLSECPAAPLNTAESECLPSQFCPSPSLVTSPLLESEDHKSMPNGSPAGEPLSSLPCSPRRCNSFADDAKGRAECEEHLLQTYSDSLSFSPNPYCLANNGLPLPLEANREVLKPSTSYALDVDHFRGQLTVVDPEDGSSAATEHKTSAAVDEVDADFLRKKCTQNDCPAGEPLSSSLCSLRRSNAFADDAKGRAECEGHLLQTYSDSLSFSPNLYCLANNGLPLPLEANREVLKPSTSYALDVDHFRGQLTVVDPQSESPTASEHKFFAAVDDVDADFTQRWNNRRKFGLSSEIDSRKKLKPTPDKSAELGTLHSDQLQSQLVNAPLSDDNESFNMPYYGKKCDRTYEDTICPGSGSETTEEGVANCPGSGSETTEEGVANCPGSGSETTEEGIRGDDETGDTCESKILHRKLSYSGVRDIVSFFRPVVARNESKAEELDALKPEHAEKNWIYTRKNRLGGRQRTIDAWIK